MLLLAMDTSTSAITVALHDGTSVIAEQAQVDARRHTEHLAPLIEAVLAEAGVTPADVTDVAVGTGPGPFTGLRVGMVTARVFGHARGIPVHGVCSLDALAAAAARTVEGELLVATDARRKEVYWARYAARDGQIEAISEPAVDRPADVPEQVRNLPTAGRGPSLYPELFGADLGVHDVSAGVLASIAVQRISSSAPMPIEALYLRRPDAVPSASTKSTVPDTWRGK